MNKTDIMEIKKRLKKTETNISKFYSFYVNGDGEVSFYRKDNLLSLRDDNETDFHKFLEIHKKLFSGKPYDLDFTSENSKELKKILDVLKNELKDEEVVKTLASKISESFLKDMYTRALITISIDSYDVPEKTSDKIKTGESDEVYSFIMCSICPVTLSKAGLSVYEETKEIKARELDSIVAPTELGFVYPSFTDRSSDDSTITLFSKNKTKTWDNFISEFLGCENKILEELNSNESEQNNQKDVVEQNIELSSVEINYSNEFENTKTFDDSNLCVDEGDDEKETVNESNGHLEIDEKITENNSIIKNTEKEINTDLTDITDLEENNSKEEIIEDETNTKELKEDSSIENTEEENLNKLLNKINMLLDNKEASYQIIDGKKYLMIPVD